MELYAVAVTVALRILDIVKPRLGAEPACAIVGEAKSGDFTYAIDHEAEQALEQIVRETGDLAQLPLAYYSEDHGLVLVHDDAKYVLVIDPVDGTRPAVCGLESCVISVALAPLTSHERVTLGEVVAACLVELKSGCILWAEAGRGVSLGSATSIGGQRPVLNREAWTKTDVSRMFWAYEQCGRPAVATHAVLQELIDTSSFAGSCFIFNSSAFAISRVIMGQLDAYIDFYGGLVRGDEADKWQAISRRLFHDKVFGLFPYDIAAAAFIAKQAGIFVSDVHGNSLDDMNLLDSSPGNVQNAVVASNQQLGEELLGYLARGLQRARQVS